MASAAPTPDYCVRPWLVSAMLGHRQEVHDWMDVEPLAVVPDDAEFFGRLICLDSATTCLFRKRFKGSSWTAEGSQKQLTLS